MTRAWAIMREATIFTACAVVIVSFGGMLAEDVLARRWRGIDL